ncbi:leucine-rich repeat domain-containing protein [Paenibacillus daejeonensis]|uniref:leucine-rich repeat domain-containing protein n=1 Tax=Paenibacillus daejeonensis TaxID=135193 RepID=UPI0003816B33|nr:leucine-rich repeat domain-containing protein [Paenibacillus daejeonensis]
MPFIQLNCPNCNGTIERQDGGTFKCPFCRTELLLKENHVYYVDQSVHHYHGTAVPAPAKTVSKTIVKGALGFIILFLAILVFYIWTSYQEGHTRSLQPNHVIRTEPQSEVLQFMMRDIFNKGAASPTQEELASLRYLSAVKQDNQWHFTYSFDDPFTNEQAKLVDYVIADKQLNAQEIEQQDFEAFPGLTVLAFNNEYDIGRSDSITYSHMEKLKSYSASFNESFRSFARYFGDRSKILHLTTQIRSNDEMALLLEFSNLQSLHLTYASDEVTDFHLLQQLPLRSLKVDIVKDLNWLSSMSNLESLTIVGTDVTDLSSLFALSQLQELKLERLFNLKTIDFVRNMPSLQVLDIESTDLVSLEPLRDKTSLTKLRLASSGDVESLEVVENLTSLTELSISSYYGTTPALKLPHVRRANLPASFIATLEAPNLQSLSVDLDTGLNAQHLVRFTQLTELNMRRGSQLLEVAALNQLPALKTIRGEETYFYEETEALFALQHVTTLECIECRFDILTEPPYQNDTLEHLILNGSYYQIDRANISNMDLITPYLTGLTGLRSFELQDGSIQSLGFMKDWQQLEVLHLENNAILDLEPLLPLTNLKKIYLAGNPVQNRTVLGNGVTVY